MLLKLFSQGAAENLGPSTVKVIFLLCLGLIKQWWRSYATH